MSTATPRPVQPEDLLAIKTVADVHISPDGGRIAYVVTGIDADKDEYRSRIWVVPAAGGEPVPFTRGDKRDSLPRWSPAGDRLAFLSDRETDKPQLYVMPADGGEARRLTSLDLGAGAPVWSPDGGRILFAARVSVETPPEDKEQRTRWEQRPRVVTRAHYKDDGAGYTFDSRAQLFVVPADGSAEARQITEGDVNHGAPAWSPDGARIAFTRTRAGVADYNLTDIWVANADGTEAHRLTDSVGRATLPSWSPDGATIACYGTDEQHPGLGDPIARVWTVPAAGGAPRRLTADYDRSAALLPLAGPPPPVWSRDGATITCSSADAGNVQIVRVTVADGGVRPVVAGERQIIIASAAPTAGRIAFCASDTGNPADVYCCAWDGADERRLTRLNEALLAGLAMPRVERRSFHSPNGGAIDGWLVRPIAERGPAPLLLHIHGGPHGFVGNVFQASAFYAYALAGRGWAVLSLNPSGSGSYGKDFALSLRGRWGEYDLPEQHAALDALVDEGVADPNRLAVAGYSYGGYMTAWIIGHSDRFKAAVVGAPVTNLESFHGTSDIGMWFGPFEMEGDIFSRRETFRRLSPVSYVDRVTTPTLILHGEADDRCPIGQGEEFYAGLVAAGKAPVELVRYPGGSHLFVGAGRPSHRVDVARRVADWVERYTVAQASARRAAAGAR